ncbi:hypothetical protein FJTKL_01154 [Diaporthe vaccinii]|uniref:Uncharacterized protein n=1 Tax=Diaporthe vaccinii TaxID=105482 RepID=A0ABR4F588_9PEZI
MDSLSVDNVVVKGKLWFWRRRGRAIVAAGVSPALYVLLFIFYLCTLRWRHVMSYNIEYRTKRQPDRRHRKQGAISIDSVSLPFSHTHQDTH